MNSQSTRIGSLQDLTKTPSDTKNRSQSERKTPYSHAKRSDIDDKNSTSDSLRAQSRQRLSLYESEIEKCLTSFFFELHERFGEDKENKLDFYESIEEFIKKQPKKGSRQETPKIQESFILQTIRKSKALDAFSKSLSNTEKLKLFTMTLKNQVNSQNKEYSVYKQLIEKISNEENYLQHNDVNSLENLHRWCQIDDFLGFSDILIEVKFGTQLALNKEDSAGATGCFCSIKVDGTAIGTTPVSSTLQNPIWETALNLELAVEGSIQNFTFEIFSNTSLPSKIGGCSLTIEEILENTLFKDKLEVYLPLKLTNSESDVQLKEGEIFMQEIYEDMNNNEMENYLSKKIMNQRLKGFLSLMFEVRLDPSFADKVGKLRMKRLEKLEVLSKEITKRLKAKFEYLKNSVDCINGLEVDTELGIVTRMEEMKFGSKKRDCLACGMFSAGGRGEGCNIF